MARKQNKPVPAQLTGWKQIAEFLGQPVATAQRWGKQGMPVRRSGRSMVASQEELSAWLARESHARAPVHIASSTDADLMADLKRGLAETRRHRRRAA
jgi:phage terminase Nu1 subunit (DNA packaging protein)